MLYAVLNQHSTYLFSFFGVFFSKQTRLKKECYLIRQDNTIYNLSIKCLWFYGIHSVSGFDKLSYPLVNVTQNSLNLYTSYIHVIAYQNYIMGSFLYNIKLFVKDAKYSCDHRR